MKVTIIFKRTRLDDMTDKEGFCRYRCDILQYGDFGKVLKLKEVAGQAINSPTKGLFQLSVLVDEQGNEYISEGYNP